MTIIIIIIMATTTGASEGIRAVMKLMTNPEGASSRRPGVMIPIPQYPLYSASLAEYDMEQVRQFFSFILVIITFDLWQSVNLRSESFTT